MPAMRRAKKAPRPSTRKLMSSCRLGTHGIVPVGVSAGLTPCRPRWIARRATLATGPAAASVRRGSLWDPPRSIVARPERAGAPTAARIR
jgi:hypothetical protein